MHADAGVLGTSPTLARLDLEARADRAEANGAWLSLLESEAALTRYTAQLVKVLGFEAPLERAFANSPCLRGLIDVGRRMRSHLIAEDLVALGRDPASVARLPRCFDEAPFVTAADALGWMYVLDRETLLHDLVRRRLVRRFPGLVTAGTRYLSAYQAGVGPRWNELGRAMDRAIGSPRAFETLVAATRTTFACHRAWYGGHRPARITATMFAQPDAG